MCCLGLHGHICWKKPLLSKIHIKKRKMGAKEHSGWSEEDWQCVVFTDESKFNLFGSDGRMCCQRRSGEEFLERNVQKKVKPGGGSLMAWGCLTQYGTGQLHCISGCLNAVQYCNILTESFLPTLDDHNLKVSNIIFQQDYDPKHTSWHAQTWFKDHAVKVLPWAPSSPDMNIIEHAWDLVDQRLHAWGTLPSNLEELWIALKEEWEKLDLESIQNLYSSVPRRVKALQCAKGSYTKYWSTCIHFLTNRAQRTMLYLADVVILVIQPTDHKIPMGVWLSSPCLFSPESKMFRFLWLMYWTNSFCRF